MTAPAATDASTAGGRQRRSRYYRNVSIWWVAPAVLFLLGFFVLPLIENVSRSIALSSVLRPGGEQNHYAKLFLDPFYLSVTAQTIALSVGVTFICVVVGYPIALYLVRHAGRWSGLVIFLLIAPLLTSIIMRTFGWRVLLARRGLLNVWALDLGLIDRPIDILNEPLAVYIGLVHVLIPFMVLSITSVLQGVDVRLEESARVLGAGRLRTFRSVTLPLSIDGIATGAILVFVLTNGSFLTMLLLGGGQVTTLALLIFQQFNLTQDVGFAAAMGNVLLLTALICLALQARYVRRSGVKS